MEKVSKFSILYLIAGPPGVGKSTIGQMFVPSHVNVLNHDDIETEYKKMGIDVYEELANQKMWEQIHGNIALGIDFGIELNLGSENQYGLLKKIHGYCKHYQIYVLLFFTDIYQLCVDRAQMRAKSGGHKVEGNVIKYMYDNTIQLLKTNINMFSHTTFINITYNSFELVYSGYYPIHNHEFVQMPLPTWILENFPEIVP